MSWLPTLAPGPRPSVDRLFPVRLGFYFGVIGLGLEAFVVLVERRGYQSVVLEGELLEQTQLAILLVAACALLVMGRQSTAARCGLYRCLAGMLACAAGREVDDTWLYQAIPNPVRLALAGGFLAYLVARERTSLSREVNDLLSRPAALLFVAGFLVVACWAQILGQRPLWAHLGSPTAGKHMVEEGLELAGYCLLGFGVFEEWLATPPSVDDS